MVSTLRRGSRLGRLLALTLGLVILGGLLVGLDRGVTAQEQPGAAGQNPAPEGAAAQYDQVRVINEQIAAQWKANKLTPSRMTTDYEFIRRASVDIIGRIATPAEIQRFLQDPPQTRRSQLIQRLLDSEDYSRNWANQWTVWLMTRSGQPKYHEEMQLWLEDQFARKDRGWDKIVTALLTATGKNEDNGAANYILASLGMPNPPSDQAEQGYDDFVPLTSRTTRLFLGLQTQCTQCHDHPFNPTWKQKNFWGVNAFFRQVKGDQPPSPDNKMMDLSTPLNLKDDPSVNKEPGVYYEERKGTVMFTRPVFLDGRKLPADSTKPRRQVLAEFVTTSPFFGKAYVNRMWGHFFGRGFTNPGPVDDFGDHNPVTHPLPANFPGIDGLRKQYDEDPTLLDYLASQFQQYNYDPRVVITWICNSEAYQLSSVANNTNDKQDAEPFFSRMLLKSMSPEELFESLMVATGAEYADKDTKNALRQQWMKNLIVNFGDDEGNEVTFNGTVVQALILMNGKEINDAVSSQDKGTVMAAMKLRTEKDILDHLFLAALNRPANEKEYRAVNNEVLYIQGGRVKNRNVQTLWQDLFWALLNSNEFILNH